VLVVCGEKKAVSSTSGMQTTVETSSLLHHRASTVVPLRMKQMEEAILQRDFQMFGRLTMMVSNDQ
jgi:diphosphomevalonate decarboxylase